MKLSNDIARCNGQIPIMGTDGMFRCLRRESCVRYLGRRSGNGRVVWFVPTPSRSADGCHNYMEVSDDPSEQEEGQ